MASRVFSILALFGMAASAFADDDLYAVRGRVVDERGIGIADVDVSTYWSANGLRTDEFRAIQAKKNWDWKDLYRKQGQMVPWGRPTSTDANGAFTISVRRDDYKLFAIDNSRKRGAVANFKPGNSDAPPMVTIELQPLARVRGTIRMAKTAEPLEWAVADVRLPSNPDVPLGRNRLVMCGTLNSQFDLWLPPGDYVFHANNDGPRHAETIPDKRVTVPAGTRQLDIGLLSLTIRPNRDELTKESKAAGKWGDYKKHYGDAPPPWHITAARGVEKDVQIANFKGKWVLLYFWSPWCRPCLGKGLPELMEFHELHEQQQDQFQILAFCLDKDREFASIDELDRQLQPVIKNVWGGKSLPFPVLLDSSFRTWESFGLEGAGELLLIDPNGHLVKGDATTLARVLVRGE
jgi:thiol-disulfide isomerase/thioredoxin